MRYQCRSAVAPLALKPAVCRLLKFVVSRLPVSLVLVWSDVSLVLEAKFERMLVLHPQQTVLESVVVVVVLEVPGTRAAPA